MRKGVDRRGTCKGDRGVAGKILGGLRKNSFSSSNPERELLEVK